MRSTSGAHYVALDHIRAIAALLVFVWHFAHGPKGWPVPFEGAPFWGPLVLFDEGHVGVSLFMTLSGYLFAKLLDGKSVIYHLFIWNRVLRLFPLLITVILFNIPIILTSSIESFSLRALYWSASSNFHLAYSFILSIPRGFVYPIWPNGGWSITTELHFYLLLPLLLFLRNRLPAALLLIVLFAIILRSYLHTIHGEVQSYAYWTIVGRIDQFILGILAYHGRPLFTGRHILITGILIAFLSLYYWFDVQGGFFRFKTYPSPSKIWIFLSTAEGLAFGSLIAWYETSFTNAGGPISTFVSKIGEYSYSIYLLHFFLVFRISAWLHTNVLDLSNFYVALPVGVACFMLMIPLGYLSMKYIEAPFLRHRVRYYRN